MNSHQKKAANFVANTKKMQWHDKALWFVREKRDIASKSLPQWESLREYANQIKTHTMGKLDFYLQQFEENAINNGIKIHWAKDAKEHNEIAYKILKQHNVKKVVKSKSMLTEECHLNQYLEQNNIKVIDTDLGERIIQLRKEPPSHIVLPAIHLTKEDVAQTFAKHLYTDPNNSDPTYLTHQARLHLREQFLSADAAITGVNFAIAQTGSIVVCTNEGNADMGTSLSKLHIASMGIEKIIPRLSDLDIFLNLLARSATGQHITTYSSHYQAPKDNGEFHIIIVDNGRSQFLQNKKYQKSLNCIRCGACMNSCPVYRRSGGHSYGYVIPGPIGSTLGAFKKQKDHSDLPFACTLCSSCSDVCPIKIDLHKQLYHHREDIVKAGLLNKKKQFILKTTALMMNYPKIVDFMGIIIRKTIPLLPDFIVYNKSNIWGKYRQMPKMPKKSFKQIYKEKKQ